MVRDYRNFPILAQQNLSVTDILKALEVDVLVVGCLKNTNRTQIEDLGIEIICGGKGEAKAAVEDYLSEEFISNDSYCENYKAAYGEEGRCKKSLFGAE